jgi:7-carboxy-7-deazaguanine synthase
MLFAGIVPLCRGLRERGLHVTIETAGTVHQPVACDLMSVSPKLSTSTPSEGDPRDPGGHWRRRHEERRLNFAVLQRLIDDHPSRQLKFVVTGPSDVAEIESVLSRLQGWAGEDVMLMPEGVSPPTPETRRWVAAACIDRGWRYCARLHIEIFGNVRGT